MVTVAVKYLYLSILFIAAEPLHNMGGMSGNQSGCLSFAEWSVPSFPVKSAPNVKIQGEMEFRVQMLDEMREDDFVIWNTSRDEKATQWGGEMTATAKGKKLKAACIDGGIRDTHQILEAYFPVFYEYRISNGSLGRCLITHYQVPIKIGDVTIKPGDVIIGDIDGVLVVPNAIAYKVLLRGEEIKENENMIFSWVHEGQSVHDIKAKGDIFNYKLYSLPLCFSRTFY